MTVAYIPQQTWLGKDEGTLDLVSTVARLNRYESWFFETIAKLRGQ